MEKIATMPDVPSKKVLLDRAFGKAAKRAAVIKSEDKEWAAREKESVRIGIAADVLYDELSTIMTETFSFDELEPFYQDLVKALIDVDHFKKALGSLKWASGEILRLRGTYVGRLRNSKDFVTMRRQRIEFFGLASATVDKVRKDLIYLGECKALLEQIPNLKPLPTVVIAGMPNVGKSSLLAALTGSKPEIQPYPFTTKGLMVSYKEGRYSDIQIIDTPGLLDRPLKDRNKIEKQAITALKNIAAVIVFIYDPTDGSYPMEHQEALFKEIKAEYKKPILEVYSKSDVKEVEGTLSVSAVTRQGLPELWEEVLRLLYRKAN